MKKKPLISIISAIDNNRAIGKDNKLLYDIPEDLRHFKQVTSGHPVIMGQRTYLSIGRPLPNRTNIILSDDRTFSVDGCEMARSPESAVEIGQSYDDEEIFVIGGGMVYRLFLPLADKLYLTIVDGEHDADTFFPEYEDQFHVVKDEPQDNGKNKYRFVEFERNKG